MKIVGRLEEDIKNGNAVLFMGAGVGQAVGLKGTQDLAEYLFNKASQPAEYGPYRNNFSSLVARLDKDAQFQRGWTNDKLSDYFLDIKNYRNLDLIKRLLKHRWQAIFTTNYDMSVEFAFESDRASFPQRLVSITNPKELRRIQDRDMSRLKYFKMHGCASDIDNNPSNAQQLVITAKDFSESSIRNKDILHEFVSLAYNVPIIFLGFNIHRNSRLLESVYQVHQFLSDSTHQQFSNFYVVLDKVDDESRFELQDLNINVLEAKFEEFIDEVEQIHLRTPQTQTGQAFSGDEIVITYRLEHKEKLHIPVLEYNRNCEQFVAYHDAYFENKKFEFSQLSRSEIIDMWKSEPSDKFIFSNRCIRRTQQQEIFEQIKKQIEKIRHKGDEQAVKDKIVLWGERGSGKSVLIRQVARQIYEELGSPVLFLREGATYIENTGKEEMIVSGWNGRDIDKFLSHFQRSADGKTAIPVIIADHMPHMLSGIKSLYKHIINHGKDVVLILVLNESDYLLDQGAGEISGEVDKEYAGYMSLKVNHFLDDNEIAMLFDSVKKDDLRLEENRPSLIQKAKDAEYGKHDLLFILYMWFDQNFRKLEDIVLDEAAKIKSNEEFKQFYSSIAVFQQYNLEPRIDLCAIALGISEKNFSALKSNPLFASLIKLRKHDYYFESYALTRHNRFTYKLLNALLDGSVEEKIENQVNIIEKVLKEIRPIDLDFVRLLFNKLYEDKSFKPAHIIRFKEASEQRPFFKKDFIINHQFAAYLIRENAQEHFDKVVYYLEVALESAPEMSHSAIIHSQGHLEAKRYKNTGDLSHYFSAKESFMRVRAISQIPDEPDYVTEVDMISDRILRERDPQSRTMLDIERTALITEAMSVVSQERHNYILHRQDVLRPFDKLTKEERSNLTEQIQSGTASHTILKYYIDSKFSKKQRDSWFKIKEVIDQYYNEKSPLATIVLLSSFTKTCFLWTAQKRFDFLRTYFNEIVKQRTHNLPFSMVAEYQRILLIDGFVLGKYDFIKGAMEEYRAIYRNSFPSFQKDEYIMPYAHYICSSSDQEKSISMFLNHSDDFFSSRKGERFEKEVNRKHGTDLYAHVFMDRVSNFYIRVLRREIGGDTQNRMELDFCVRFGADGFKAADIRRI
jgi:GTPase SAR1 family protein